MMLSPTQTSAWEAMDDCNFRFNNKNYNLLDCDWFRKLLFFTNSLAKLLSDSLLLDSLLSDSSISKSRLKNQSRARARAFMFLPSNYKRESRWP